MTITEQKNQEYCPECSGFIYLITDRAEKVCSECGLVVAERLFDKTYSVRAYTPDEIKKRITNSPSNNNELPIELMTKIEKKDLKYYDQNMQRVAKQDRKLTTWGARNLLIAEAELKRVSHNLSVPPYIKKNTLRLYKKASIHSLLRGSSVMAMIMACLWYNIKKENLPRIFNDITKQSSIPAKKIRQAYRRLARFCAENKIIVSNKVISDDLKNTSTISQVTALIPRFCADLDLDIEVEKTSIKILKEYISKNFLSGINPNGLCGGVIYLVSKMRGYGLTQKEIASLVGVTEVTLRTRFKEMSKKIKILG